MNKNRKFVKVSDLPNTWIEVDAGTPDDIIRKKFEINQKRARNYLDGKYMKPKKLKR